MDWFVKIVKILGTINPISAPFVQILSEKESSEIKHRIEILEDPISNLHEYVVELSRIVYKKMKVDNSKTLDFDTEFYDKYERALICLESNNYIECHSGFVTGREKAYDRFAMGISFNEPSYIMYMCNLEEDAEKMKILLNTVDGCEKGTTLNGFKIQQDIGLPLPVINAMFMIFKAKGYGLQSGEFNSCDYIGIA
ncbi:MAG: hypothetical protein PF574_05640 [Candidatus Delongbacteria bacterium]|jgi:hypothetical protein|nr:hypothetical protein [Candidatus Delongbacteria bacterium]